MTYINEKTAPKTEKSKKMLWIFEIQCYIIYSGVSIGVVICIHPVKGVHSIFYALLNIHHIINRVPKCYPDIKNVTWVC